MKKLYGKTTEIVFLSAFMISLLVIACSAAKTSTVNTNPEGVAIKGYDPVAYFTEGKPVKGSPAFEHEWKGAKWRFANAEHLKLFTGEPKKYAPQYGGY